MVFLSPNNVHTPAANIAAIVNYPAASAASALRNRIQGIAWSYAGGDPTGGNLKIEDGAGNVVFSMDITSAGAGFVPHPQPIFGSPSTALIITLAAGGASVTGKVSVLSHRLTL